MTKDSSVQSGGRRFPPQATYGAVKRRVASLREEIRTYEAETARLKRNAEYEGGHPERLRVDSARSAKLRKLLERQRKAEADLAAWRPSPKAQRPDVPFSTLVRAALQKGNPNV
jgi:hypothetical protein